MCLGPCTGWLLPLVTYHLVDPSLLHLTANNRVGENWKKPSEFWAKDPDRVWR